MTEKKKYQKEFSTCLENIPFAEMMQKMMGQKGVGSICAEMMNKVTEKKGEGCGVHCTEMMRSMMDGCRGVKNESNKTKEEGSNVRSK
jgi:histone H3/H4